MPISTARNISELKGIMPQTAAVVIAEPIIAEMAASRKNIADLLPALREITPNMTIIPEKRNIKVKANISDNKWL